MTILPLPKVKKSLLQSTAPKRTKKVRPAVMSHAFNPRTGESEARGVPAQPGQVSEILSPNKQTNKQTIIKSKRMGQGQLNA